MAVIDDHGRVFGRWNIVDALIGVVLLALMPLAYSAYVLFRPSAALVLAIEPATVMADRDAQIGIRGQNLRPYMRVSFNERQGRTFLFSDPTKAEVHVAGLPAGEYDVILYDQAQERARLPKGLTVLAQAKPETQLDLIGSFTGVTQAMAAQLKDGTTLTGVGRITRIGKAEPSVTRAAVGPGAFLDVPSTNAFNIPAVIRADCSLVQRNGGVTCMALDTALMQDIVLQAATPGGNVLFQIDQVLATTPTQMIEVRVRLIGEHLALARLKVGDRDARRRNELAASGTVIAAAEPRSASSSVAVTVSLPASGLVDGSIVSGDLASRDVTLRLPVQVSSGGWSYGARPLRVGAGFTFYGRDYELRGTVLQLAGPPETTR